MEDTAWKEYEKDFELRKNEITSRLRTIKKGNVINSVYKIWIDQAIEFINESKG